MRTKIFILATAVMVACLFSISSAQVPQMINYQGNLTKSGGGALDTTVSMTFKIYADSTTSTSLWSETQSSIEVKDGIFNVLLGSVNSIPDSVFKGSIRYLGVKVGSDNEMTPRKPIVSVGYAYKSSEADTAEYARGGGEGDNDWVFPTSVGGTNPRPYLYTYGQWGIARYGNTLYGNADASHVNLGVGSITGTNGQDYGYCTVGGGEGNTASNEATTVGGGSYNTASNEDATVGGGIANTASGGHATVGGGLGNTASWWSATIGGGQYNTVNGFVATIGGGYSNFATGRAATVGGGELNRASTDYATVGGGYTDTASGFGATVGGGGYNAATGEKSTIGGGSWNRATGSHATIGGGASNTAFGGATVAGGEYNTASTDFATVGGGYLNTASALFSTLCGGEHNTASSYLSTIGGGSWNSVSGDTGTVGGGYNNTASGDYATISGGKMNTANGYLATVSGGINNQATNTWTTVGGGDANLASGMYGTVAGGQGNVASGYYHATVGGGAGNSAGWAATVGGGGYNSASPISNTHGGTVGGGQYDTANGEYATVPGGYNNTAYGDYSLAAGNGVKLTYAADYTFAFGYNFTTSTPNAVIFYHPGAATRVGVNLTNPAYAIDLPNNANTSGQGRANAWTTYSSRRWKENIRPIDGALDKVMKLKGVYFDWKESKKQDIGMIAEEVGEVIPEVVAYEENGVDAQSMDYARLVALLVEGMKTQQKEIELLKAEIKTLRTGTTSR